MKPNKKFLLHSLMLSAAFFLTACSQAPITENSTGIWDKGIVYNFSQFIIWLSNIFGGNYGIGIIIFTILTRILLLPLLHFQFKASRQMAILQPKVNELRDKYSARDRETQMQLQEEISALYEREGVNQFASMLPLFIQLPIMIALYQAISRTEILKTGHFLWLNLGEADPYFILPVLAAVFTYIASWLTMKMQDAGGVGKVMLYFMPAMILIISLPLPSAISLYWVVGNIIATIQTLVMNNPFKFREEQLQKQRAERQRQKNLEKAKNPKKRHAKRK